MNGTGGPSEARRAKEGASVDFAEEMKDTTGLRPWRLHGRGETCLRACLRVRESRSAQAGRQRSEVMPWVT